MTRSLYIFMTGKQPQAREEFFVSLQVFMALWGLFHPSIDFGRKVSVPYGESGEIGIGCRVNRQAET